MTQPLIRVKKAARLLGYSESYMSLMAREGTFTRYYVGPRSYLLDRDEVLQHPRKNARK